MSRFPEDIHIVEKYRNMYEFTVDESDSIDTIVRNSKTILMYEYDLYEFVTDSTPTKSKKFGKFEIVPTNSQETYIIVKENNRAVQTTPDKEEMLYNGIIQVLENCSEEILESVYDKCEEQCVRQQVVNDVQSQFNIVNQNDMQICFDGWIIQEEFLLTWNGNVYHKNDSGDFCRDKIVDIGPDYTVLGRNSDSGIELVMDGYGELYLEHNEVQFFSKAKNIANIPVEPEQLPVEYYTDEVVTA